MTWLHVIYLSICESQKLYLDIASEEEVTGTWK